MRRLRKLYPEPRTALEWHGDPFRLLAATILSAQCTDERVNQVTQVLFARYPDAAAMARASQSEIEGLVRSTGFFRNKAKHLREAAQRIVSEHDGRVPDSMEALLALPGVARKTANCVLGTAFGQRAGVVVDTHVGRLARRLGLSSEKDPVKVERDLMALFPRSSWTDLSHLLIDHGRAVCRARKADCEACFLAPECPKLLEERRGSRTCG